MLACLIDFNVPIIYTHISIEIYFTVKLFFIIRLSLFLCLSVFLALCVTWKVTYIVIYSFA